MDNSHIYLLIKQVSNIPQNISTIRAQDFFFFNNGWIMNKIFVRYEFQINFKDRALNKFQYSFFIHIFIPSPTEYFYNYIFKMLTFQ